MREKTANGIGTNFEKLLEGLRSIVDEGEHLLKSGTEGFKGQAMEGIKTTDRAVREHPYQSMAVVFGLGVVVGVLATGLLRRGLDYDDYFES